MLKILLAAVAVSFMTACSGIKVDDYSEFTPVLNPETFFEGELSAHGVVKNRGGKVIRTFNAVIDASWQDGVGTLVEDFVFDDGEEQQRIWTLVPDGEGGYTGTAGDVVGEGRMSRAGNSLFFDYVLRIPWKDGSIDVRVDDRMYLISDDVLINESRMLKYGIRVGNLSLVILRHPDK